MNSVFDFLHHFQMRLQQNKTHKNRRQKVSVFTAGSKLLSISRVMGMINEFGFRLYASFSDALTAE